MTCKTCLYCRGRDKDTSMGVCHRMPPTRMGFPMVSLASWCGEYASKEEPQPIMAPPQPLMMVVPVVEEAPVAKRSRIREWLKV